MMGVPLLGTPVSSGSWQRQTVARRPVSPHRRPGTRGALIPPRAELSLIRVASRGWDKHSHLGPDPMGAGRSLGCCPQVCRYLSIGAVKLTGMHYLHSA
jgi:hypothetical protein